MQKSTLHPMGVRSLYPLDFNKNNPNLEGFEEWRQYIKEEVRKCDQAKRMVAGTIEVYIISVDQLNAILNMESLRLQARAIIDGGRS